MAGFPVWPRSVNPNVDSSAIQNGSEIREVIREGIRIYQEARGWKDIRVQEHQMCDGYNAFYVTRSFGEVNVSIQIKRTSIFVTGTQTAENRVLASYHRPWKSANGLAPQMDIVFSRPWTQHL